MNTVLVRNWWALVLRGVLAVLFGLIAFAMLGITLAVLVLLFGGYAVADGIFAIIAGIRAASLASRSPCSTWWRSGRWSRVSSGSSPRSGSGRRPRASGCWS